MATAALQASATESSSPADLAAPPASLQPDDDDQAMTDDMRVAIAALGLMREGSLGGSSSGGGVPAPGPSSLPHHPSSDQPLFPPPSRHHSRAASSSHRSDPSRSTSTASTASASEAWTTTGGTSASGSTGFSSPVGTASISGGPGPYDDADMSEKGLGEAEMDGQDEAEQQQDPRFMARVSQLPYVSGGLEWYERSKASSRVVKLGADLVESSFSAVSRPITNNVQLGGLDDFACRQLDRIGAPGSSPGRKSPASQQQQLEEELRGRSSETIPVRQSATGSERGEGEMPPPSSTDHGQQRASSTSGAGGQVATVSQRSRWQTVLLEAGGLGAAVSEESLKSLRYCLQWLLYATAHLDHQIATLRDFILSLRAHNRHSSPSSSHALVAASASAHLSQIKHDVVETIRKVVEVVSKYAGAALPEQAKRYVRQTILSLPVKWASAIEGRPGGPVTAAARARRRRERSGSVGGMSVAASESDVGTPRPERMHESYFPGAGSSSANGANGDADGEADQLNGKAGGEGNGEDAGREGEMSSTEEAADSVLTFAVESLEMLRSVTNIFGESVEKAEAWIERLRIVGLDRQRQRQAAAAAAGQQPFAPPSVTTSTSNPAAYALPPSGHTSVSTSPALSSSATFDDSTAGVGTKRRRSSNRGGEDGAVGNGAATTGTDVGATTDGEGEGLGRRKRGARRENGGS
ncbi:hypothetical protein JCM6882_003770 [Rhodosporidiobolus microsporus]